MVSASSIRKATPKLGVVVARLIFGGFLVLLVLGLAGYFTLKAIFDLMTYEYRVMEKAYRIRQRIPSELAHQVENGSSVVVRYLPGDPEVARLA